MSIRSKFVLFRRWSCLGLIGLTINHLWSRLNDDIESVNGQLFVEHTKKQLKANRFSGMHPPFVTSNQSELKFFRENFPQYSSLIPNDENELLNRHSMETSVRFQPLSQCRHANEIEMQTDTLVVGGPPSLIAAVQLTRENWKDLIYFNNEQHIGIFNGSAWHLEEDGASEAPTNYHPIQFLIDQLQRILFRIVLLKDIQQTGEFPWRTIDWREWIQHPDHWWRAVKIFVKYQWKIVCDNRDETLQSVAKQCRQNELFFSQLNHYFNKNLLFEQQGSIIIARNQQEIQELNQLKSLLDNENRMLTIVSPDQFVQRYSFVPSSGIYFADKTHDRVLNPNFMKLFKENLCRNEIQVFDGILQTIYLDENDREHSSKRVARFIDSNGQQYLIEFQRFISSLGNQMFYQQNGQRLFDVISARGVSILAHLYLPKSWKLPAVVVCGGTNHLTKLNSHPISFDDQTDLYLVRLTAGACITPNIHHHRTSYYDSTIALGLVKSVENVFGKSARLEPLIVYGCNRQVSQYGQIHWFQPFSNIFIQYGAAGGGLTRAPDFITNLSSNQLGKA